MVSRDVKFVESKGYYDEKSWDNLQDLTHAPSDRATNLRTILESLGISQPNGGAEARSPPTPETPQAEPVLDASHLDPEGGSETEQEDHEAQIHDQDGGQEQHEAEPAQQVEDEEDQQGTEPEPEAEVPTLRRSTRIRHGPENWKNTRVYFNANAVNTFVI